MKNFNIATVFAVMAMTCCISSCSMADMDSSILGDTGMAPEASPEGGDSGEEPGGEGGNSQAGKVTAGEWNDLDNWAFWNGLSATAARALTWR